MTLPDLTLDEYPKRHVTFFVAGTPVPKQSTRVVSFGNKVHAYTPQRIKDWHETVMQQALVQVHGQETMTGELEVELTFYLADKHRRDCDNLSKPVTDAMNKVVYTDDSQIMKLTIEKRYDGKPGVNVTVTER